MANDKTSSPGKAAPRLALRILTKVHVFLHRLSGGRLFNRMAGGEVCFVTMTGAKSGNPVTIPLIYLPHQEGVLLVASQTGRPTNPIWYKNLVKHPEIEVRYRSDTMKLRAREAGAEEKAALWLLIDEMYADFALYRARTDRDIPVFVCEPA